MEFGIKPSQGGHEFDATMAQTIRAEELGFSSVYLSEHHGHETHWPTPLLALGAISSRTSTIDLGTAIKLLPLHNPVHLAGRIAMLDAISDGRTKIGFGLGWDKHEFDTYGVPRTQRGARMTEYLEILNELFAGGQTTYDGEFYQFEDFELFPKPITKPRPRMLVGGASDRAYERASTLADGWIAPGGELAEIAEKARKYQSWDDDGQTIVTNQGSVVRESAADATRATKRFLRQFHEPLIERGHPYSGPSVKELNHTLEHELESHIESRCLVAGTPDQCIEKIQRIHDNTGFDEFILRVSTYGLPKDDGLETIELLASEVLPSF